MKVITVVIVIHQVQSTHMVCAVHNYYRQAAAHYCQYSIFSRFLHNIQPVEVTFGTIGTLCHAKFHLEWYRYGPPNR